MVRNGGFGEGTVKERGMPERGLGKVRIVDTQ